MIDLAKHASAFHCGQGLQSGACLRSWRLQVASLRKRGRGDFAAMMETAACAGIWTNARCADVYPVSPICERCGDALETDYHRYWACPGNDLIDDSTTQRTNYLNVPAAERGSQCLFLRGIIPAAMIPIDPPREALMQFVGICINTHGLWMVSLCFWKLGLSMRISSLSTF